MATTPPVVDFRDPGSLATPVTSITLTGSGPNNTIPIGGTSNSYTLRVYNNYANAAGIADATNCTFSSYDATGSYGTATINPVLQTWAQVKATTYNGVTTNADTQYFAVGGSTKHASPFNSGTLPGSATNYITFLLQVVVPSTATGASYNQGFFVEYNYNF